MIHSLMQGKIKQNKTCKNTMQNDPIKIFIRLKHNSGPFFLAIPLVKLYILVVYSLTPTASSQAGHITSIFYFLDTQFTFRLLQN